MWTVAGFRRLRTMIELGAKARAGSAGARRGHILSLGDNNFLFALNFLLARNSENLES